MNKKFVLALITLLVLIPANIKARSGCCSGHSGVAGCSEDGRQICNDGTLSPSCTCTPSYIYGCTDKTAKNYKYNANKNDGSCIYAVEGCTNINSLNYNSKAEKDDGSCIKKVYGCMDKNAENYNVSANLSDNSCVYKNQEQSSGENTPDSIGTGIISVAAIGSTFYFLKKKNNRKVKP